MSNYAQPPAPAPMPAEVPGKTMGIVGLVLAFVFAPVGIIVSAIGMSQSKKAGYKNTLALVGLILSIVFTIIWVVSIILFIMAAAVAASHVNDIYAEICTQMGLGPGPHDVNGQTITCP